MTPDGFRTRFVDREGTIYLTVPKVWADYFKRKVGKSNLRGETPWVEVTL